MDPLALETMTLHPVDRATKARQHAAQVAQQVEDVFVRTLVGSLRQTGSVGGEGDGMFGGGPGADTYGDWFDENLAAKVSSAGHIGIKEQLMLDFERNGEIPKQKVDRALHGMNAAIADRITTMAALHAQPGGIDVLR